MEFLSALNLARAKAVREGAGLSSLSLDNVFPTLPSPGLFNLLETFLANSPIGFSYFDESLRYVSVNQSFAMMFGYAPAQFLGQLVRDVSPEGALWWEPALQRVFEFGRPELDLEFRLPHHDVTHEVQTASVNLYPVLGDEGEVVGIGAMLVDVTERRGLEARLREKEERLRFAIESASLGTWDWDLLTGAMLLSDRAKAMCGLSTQAIVNWEVFLSSIHPEDRASVDHAIQRAFGGPGETYCCEYRSIGIEDGKQRWLAVRGNVRFNEKNIPLTLTGVLSDVTQQKEVEQIRRSASDELVRSNAELERFASVASHDLREPVRTVANYVALLKRRNQGNWDPVSLEFLDFATSGAKRMGELIDDLLFYSRVSGVEPKKEELSLNVVLDKTKLNLGVAIEEARAQITSAELPKVLGNFTNLIQVFQNLLANAIKYHRSGSVPRVHVSAEKKGPEWVICFKDDGIGFEAKDAMKIFEAFVRLHGHSEYSGSGLGLATCRKIITQHGGRIWANSSLGEGSSFYFTIPALKE